MSAEDHCGWSSRSDCGARGPVKTLGYQRQVWLISTGEVATSTELHSPCRRTIGPQRYGSALRAVLALIIVVVLAGASFLIRWQPVERSTR